MVRNDGGPVRAILEWDRRLPSGLVDRSPQSVSSDCPQLLLSKPQLHTSAPAMHPQIQSWLPLPVSGAFARAGKANHIPLPLSPASSSELWTKDHQGQMPGKEKVAKGSTQKGQASYCQTTMAPRYCLTPSSGRSHFLVALFPGYSLQNASSLTPL